MYLRTYKSTKILGTELDKQKVYNQKFFFFDLKNSLTLCKKIIYDKDL
jgi:hypothetical protein